MFENLKIQIPAIIILFVALVVGLVIYASVRKNLEVRQEHYKVKEINIDVTDNQISAISDETLLFTQDSSNSCKAGYNPGQQVGGVNQGNARGLGSVVGILTSQDQNGAVNFIINSNKAGLHPILRMCYKSSDPNHCSDFRDSTLTGGFINEVANTVERIAIDDDELNQNVPLFTYIIGPNEPISERWLIKDAGFPELYDSDANLITNSDSYKSYFEYVGRYSKVVYDTVRQAGNKENVTMYGAAFNLNYFGAAGFELIDSYIDGFGEKKLCDLDGFAGNSYNIYDDSYNLTGSPNAEVTAFYDTYIDKCGGNFELTLTEFGPFIPREATNLVNMTDTALQNRIIGELQQNFQNLASKPQVKYINFFAPFAGSDNPEFSFHNIPRGAFNSITSCNISGGNEGFQGDFESAPLPEIVVPGNLFDDSSVIPDGADGSSPGGNLVSSLPDLNVTDFSRIGVPSNAYERGNLVFDSAINSCEVLGSTQNFATYNRLQLSADESKLVGARMLVTEVENFPMVGHLGAISNAEVDYSLDIETNGIPQSPYNPACLSLSTFISGGNVLIGKSFPGFAKLGFENGFMGDVYVPNLGSAMACLNVLAMENGLSGYNERIENAHKGFDSAIYTEEERILAENLLENAIQEQYSRSFVFLPNLRDRVNSVFEYFGFSDDEGRATFANEPIIIYEDVNYCQNTEANLKVDYLNTTANAPSQSISTPQIASFVEKIELDIADYCAGRYEPDFELLIGSTAGSGAKQILCAGNAPKQNLRSSLSAPVYAYTDLGGIKNMSVPGGLTAKATLFKLIDEQMSNRGGSLRLPPNGVKAEINFAFYDPCRSYNCENLDLLDLGININNATQNGGSEYYYRDEMNAFLVDLDNYSLASNPNSSFAGIGGSQSGSYEFILPWDLQTLFQNYLYLNNETTRVDHDF